jgi:glycosyltransferase involved in cell wall biosynthesis
LVRSGIDRDKIVLIPNGVDTADFYPCRTAGLAFRAEHGVPSQAFVVGLVAAHRREKRHDRFISVIETMAERGLDVWGVMVGGGFGIEGNSRLAAASPAYRRLLVAGRVSDMRAAYSAMDVVVLVSDDIESYPMCFIEAQACGVPVVGMDVGGVRETFEDGVTGLLVRQGDLSAMAEVIESLARDKDLRASMAVDCREFAETHLSLDRMISDYEQLLSRADASCS